jgi:tetratricopeptide (TPR) repeat protein
LIPLEKIQSLYDQNRFLEAFRESAHYWKPPANLDRFSSDELILGARLASRLGGSRLSRWLFRAASERDPSSPRVRYFVNRVRHRRRSLLDELRDREAHPTLDTDDAELQSSWLAWNAVLWATLRDFARAKDGLERARALYSKDGWVSSCESDVLGMEDRWEEALKAAELSWELNPGSPYTARSLGASLLNLGRVEEAAERLRSAAEGSESYEVVVVACWQQAAFADTLEGEERQLMVERAQDLAEKLPSLAPLADRESRSLFARIRLDLAQLADDHAEMERWAREVHAPYFQRVLENLRKNPRGTRIRLPYRREMQKHMTCLPASLASCLAGLDVDIDANVMAAEVTYDGTANWAAAEWLERRGLEVRSFVVTPEYSGIFPTHLQEIRAACARALAGLPHDHCARYLAHVQAEACALLDDKEGFLATWTEHRGYFDREGSKGEWFQHDRRHLLEDIPKMAQLLEQNARWKYRTTLWRLRWGQLYRTILSSHPARAARRIPLVVWWLLFLGMVALLANL